MDEMGRKIGHRYNDFYKQCLGIIPDDEWMKWVEELATDIRAELEQGRV